MNELSPVPHPTCVTCKFHSLESMQGQIARQMVCRRNPPQMSMITTPQGIMAQTYFPIVRPDVWCWSHESKPIATDITS